MPNTPTIAIGHLTLLDTAPPDLVTLSREAGFDAVGVRVSAAGPTEEPWPMRPGSPMLAETRRRLDDTGVEVLDVEIIRLGPETKAADHQALYEAGATLGARFINVIADDPDLGRARDTLAAIAAEARPYGLRPVVEAMVYSQVRSLADAISVVDGSGGGVTVDPLHLFRFGGSVDQLRLIDRALLLYFQVCDAPLEPPEGLERPSRLPRGQSLDIDDRALEARAARLLPGDGELPLAEIMRAMPDDIPVSVEAPNQVLLERIGAAEFARRARRAVDALLSTR
jgi:sugar phosphate isomerase/epimerase